MAAAPRRAAARCPRRGARRALLIRRAPAAAAALPRAWDGLAALVDARGYELLLLDQVRGRVGCVPREAHASGWPAVTTLGHRQATPW